MLKKLIIVTFTAISSFGLIAAGETSPRVINAEPTERVTPSRSIQRDLGVSHYEVTQRPNGVTIDIIGERDDSLGRIAVFETDRTVRIETSNSDGSRSSWRITDNQDQGVVVQAVEIPASGRPSTSVVRYNQDATEVDIYRSDGDFETVSLGDVERDPKSALDCQDDKGRSNGPKNFADAEFGVARVLFEEPNLSDYLPERMSIASHITNSEYTTQGACMNCAGGCFICGACASSGCGAGAACAACAVACATCVVECPSCFQEIE